MFRRIQDKNIPLIYGAVFLLGAAYGLSLALIALHLDDLGFSKRDIGTLAVWFASGIVGLSLPAGFLIRKFSAKVTLVASFVGYAAAVSIFPLLVSYETIAAARFLDGAFSVCIWVSCETILLQRAGKDNKAYITSLYAMAIAIGYVIGPIAAKAIVYFLPMRMGFFASGIIAAAATVLVILRLDPDPRETGLEAAGGQTGTPTRALELLTHIRTSCFGTFAYGYFQASVVLFLPLYLVESKGVPKDYTILVPAFFASGMLLFSNVAGRIGDRYGHLLVMRVLAAIGTTMILSFVFLPSFAVMCGAVFIAGASLGSISPISLALQGVVTEPRDYSRSNAFYNVFYAAGILLGPLASSILFQDFGGAAMLFHLAAMFGAFVVFTLVFRLDDPAARPAKRPVLVDPLVRADP